MTDEEVDALTGWVVLVSPWESTPAEWTALPFRTETEARAHISDCDLTKEYWVLPVVELVQLLREKYP